MVRIVQLYVGLPNAIVFRPEKELKGFAKVFLKAGESVSDIRLETELEIEGTTSQYPYNPALLPYYYTGIVQQISTPEFEILLGHSIPDGKWTGELGHNDAVCQMYYARSSLARFIYNRLTSMKKKSDRKESRT